MALVELVGVRMANITENEHLVLLAPILIHLVYSKECVWLEGQVVVG